MPRRPPRLPPLLAEFDDEERDAAVGRMTVEVADDTAAAGPSDCEHHSEPDQHARVKAGKNRGNDDRCRSSQRRALLGT